MEEETKEEVMEVIENLSDSNSPRDDDDISQDISHESAISEKSDEETIEKLFPYNPKLNEKEVKKVEKFLSNPANFKSLRYQLGSEFDHFGGHFIPICGDGNCFFRAVSVSLTSCADLPYGTMAFHNELR